MTRVSTALLSCGVLLAFSGAATSARADTLRIRSGNIVTSWNTLGDSVIAEGFLVDGGGLFIGSSMEDQRGDVRLAVRPVVAQGGLLDLTGTFTSEDTLGGYLNDVSVRVSPFAMSLRASPTHVECSGPAGGMTCSGSAPFTFSADLTLTPEGGHSFVEHIVGGGVARGSLDGTGATDTGAFEYDITASATPEPATLSLVAAGALMAAAGVWRTRENI